jgi:hypothetical protein
MKVSKGVSKMAIAVICIAAVILYMLPGILAKIFGFKDSNKIIFANLLYGWTIVGWLILMAYIAMIILSNEE